MIRWFWVFLLVIISFACIDSYLNLHYGLQYQNELNPLAKWVLFVSNNNLALLFSLKMFGTSLSVAFLVWLYFHNRNLAAKCSCVIAFILILLLGFMIY